MKNVVLMLNVLLITAVTGCDALDMIVLRPSPDIRRTPADFGFESDSVRLRMKADEEVSIWHVRTSLERKGILVIVPGLDANKSRYTIGLPIYVDDGWDVILMDYVGYGESTGTASFEGLIESTNAVFDYAFTQDDTVVGVSISLGTSVLARVAADYDLTACVFEGTLNLWEESSLFAEHIGIGSPIWGIADAVAALSTPFDYNTKHWIAQVEEPKLFLHSPDDNVTPFPGAWEIFQLAPQPKHFVAIQGDHAMQMFIDPVLYRSVVNGWLDGVLRQDPILNDEFQVLLEEEVQASLDGFGL
ncbi:MAG: alpha/beta hydrolase [Phycisphaerales bacterium]|nr:alpha/beta hydrolase [Phycisphaerales bacterium]